MKRVCIIGTGYVGLVTGACLANLGNKVICVDNDLKKIKNLKNNILPIFEPGLEELVLVNKNERRINFSASVSEGVKNSEIIFIAVDAPVLEDGRTDLSKIEDVAVKIAKFINRYKIIVMKSTVPVNTGVWVENIIKKNMKNKVKFDMVSNPEFLQEGIAVKTFMNPDRIIIGASKEKAISSMVELYKPLNAPFIIADLQSAELIKLCSNAFLSTKISFINMISQVCEAAKADVTRVAKGIGADKRIGEDFFQAGVGFGGFCLPKDLSMLINVGENLSCNFELLKAVKEVNFQQRVNICEKVENVLKNLKNKTIGILGLSFKPNTDDLRDAPSIDIINILKDKGANVKVYDPQALSNARKILKKVGFCKDVYDLAKNAEALILVTEWTEFRNIDLIRIKKVMKRPLIIDGRNFYDPERMKNIGFEYYGTGKS